MSDSIHHGESGYVMTNSTERLYNNLLKINVLAGNMSTTKALGAMLSIQGGSRQVFLVGRFIHEMDRQLESVSYELENFSGAPEGEWRGVVGSVRNGFRAMVESPHIHLSQINSSFSGDTITHLKLYARYIPKNEILIPASDIVEIHVLLDAMQASLNNTKIPASLRFAIEDILDQFRASLAAFAARGGKALSDVILTAADDMLRNGKELAENVDDPAVISLKEAWIKVLGVGRAWRDVSSIVALVEGVKSKIERVLELLPKP